jgi:hypothetical protein
LREGEEKEEGEEKKKRKDSAEARREEKADFSLLGMTFGFWLWLAHFFLASRLRR